MIYIYSSKFMPHPSKPDVANIYLYVAIKAVSTQQ